MTTPKHVRETPVDDQSVPEDQATRPPAAPKPPGRPTVTDDDHDGGDGDEPTGIRARPGLPRHRPDQEAASGSS